MSLKNILELKNLYLLKSCIESKLSFTPFSQIIKQNIANEWIKCNQRILPMSLFVTSLIENLDPMTTSQMNPLKPIVENYKNHYGHYGNLCHPIEYPIGIIEKLVFSSNETNSVLNSKQTDCLVFTSFCPKEQSLQLFNKIQSLHNHWFKNLSKSPLNAAFSMVHSGLDNVHCSINYKLEETDRKVEDLIYYNNSSALKEFGITDCDIICCNLDLDTSLLSFLCDAFTTQTYKNQKSVKKMKVNPSISAFKIAFTLRDNNQMNVRMTETIQHLIEMLKEFEISVFPFVPNKQLSIEDYDELGIPFTVILDEENLHNGVVALRNRDTDTEEWLHISSFQKTVCLYLKVIHPSKIRNKVIN